MSRDCAQAHNLLSERLDRPLNAREQTALQQHLARCHSCTQHEQALLGGLAGLAALPPVAGSRAVRAAVLERIETRQHRAWLGQGARLLAAVAACVLFALVLAAILRGGAPSLSDDDPGLSAGQSVGGGATETPDAEAGIVATPTLAPASATVCLPGILTSSAGGADQDLPANAFQIWVVVELAEDCGLLAEEVTITLVDANGAPLAIENNPITLPVISLSSRPLTYAGVVWENWCGAPGVSVEAMHGAGGAGRSLDATPACIDPDAPSRLTSSDTPPADEPLPPPPTATADSTCALALSSLEMTQEPFGDDVTITVSGIPAQPCSDGATLTVMLVDGTGGLLDIENNPAVVPAHTMGDDGRLFAAVNWTNWCGDADVLAALSTKEGEASQGVSPTPDCLDHNAPSRLVWESYADAVEDRVLETCGENELAYIISTEQTHGDLLIYANAGAEDHRAGELPPGCYLPSSELTLTITDKTGNPLPIDGNGLIFNLTSPEEGFNIVAPIAGFANAQWENWCGDAETIVAHISFAGRTAELVIDTPPACEDAASASTLVAISAPDWGSEEPAAPTEQAP